MIHHATIKRAAALGIVLTDKGGTAVAFHTERNRTIENADPKIAVFLCQLAAKLALEYPHIVITNEGDAEVDGEGIVGQIVENVEDENGDPLEDLADPKTLEAAFAQIVDLAPEAEAVEEDEEEGSGKVVVAERYKQEYKARGDASGCGDWLHVTLKRFSSEVTMDGKAVKVFDEPGFTAMLIANGVTIKGKFADMPMNGGKGWEGRYRMNGRQMLEAPLLRAKGVLQLENGTSVVMPTEDYEALLDLKRHRALKEELETAESEADAKAEAEAPKGKGKRK